VAGSVFLHPSRDHADAFVTRLLDQYQRQVTSAAIVTLSGGFGYEWFQALLDDVVCFPNRLSRDKPAGVVDEDLARHRGLPWPDEERFIHAFKRFRADRQGRRSLACFHKSIYEVQTMTANRDNELLEPRGAGESLSATLTK